MKKYLIKELLDDTGLYTDDLILHSPIINTSIEEIGNFVLSPFQVGLISCIIHYYFGDKENVKEIINESFNIVIESTKISSDKAQRFLKLCQKNNFLDYNYNLTEYTEFIAKKIKTKRTTFHTGNSMGYMFEIFLIKHIEKTFKNKTNSEKFLNKSLGNKHVLYMTSILYVIYVIQKKYGAIPLIRKIFEEDNNSRIDELQNKVSFPENFFEKLISKEIMANKEIFFEFKYNLEPVDIVVKKSAESKEVISMIDLKVSELDYKKVDGKDIKVYNDVDVISTSKKKVEDQILNDVGDDSEGVIKNFNIGILRITYSFKQNNIEIEKSESVFSTYNKTHVSIMSDEEESDYTLSKEVISSEDEGMSSYVIQNINEFIVQKDFEAKKMRSIEEKSENFSDFFIEEYIYKEGQFLINKIKDYYIPLPIETRKKIIEKISSKKEDITKTHEKQIINRYNKVINKIIEKEIELNELKDIENYKSYTIEIDDKLSLLINEERILEIIQTLVSYIKSGESYPSERMRDLYKKHSIYIRKYIIEKIYNEKENIEQTKIFNYMNQYNRMINYFIRYEKEEGSINSDEIESYESYLIQIPEEILKKEREKQEDESSNKILNTMIKNYISCDKILYLNSKALIQTYITQTESIRNNIQDKLTTSQKKVIKKENNRLHIENYNNAIRTIFNFEFNEGHLSEELRDEKINDSLIETGFVLNLKEERDAKKTAESLLNSVYKDNDINLRTYRGKNVNVRMFILEVIFKNKNVILQNEDESNKKLLISKYNKLINAIVKYETKKEEIKIDKIIKNKIEESNHLNKNLLREIYSYLFK
tara:strand:- start:1110 stop:3572 length:2463 start_codon:yes stop_codon:yes gene_type:complete